MKNIVVLDAHTLTRLVLDGDPAANPSWNAMKELGTVTLHDRTAPSEILERCADAEIVLTNKVHLDAGTIAGIPKLEYIGVMATGYNIVDVKFARSKGVVVTNIPGYGSMSVAQSVFALLLELSNLTGAHAAAVRAGKWVGCPDFCFSEGPTHELAGKNFGVVGFGDIGQAACRIASAFGMNILVHSRSQREVDFPVEWLPLDELMAKADVISLHCPLTPETKHVINRTTISRLKPTAILINTSRGALIDEAALAEALNEGLLAGFGADVLETEPQTPGNPLPQARNTVITPHIAWSSVEARHRLMDLLTGNLRAYLAGSPVNVV